MKYSILAFAAAMLFTGCSAAPVPAEPAPEDSSSTAMQEQPAGSENMLALPIHEDLTKQYNAAILKTNKGDMTVRFYAEESPVTVNNFLNLAKDGFYNGITFHRVIKDFMIQGGDPNSKNDDRSLHGTGGPGYKFGDEFNTKPLVRGSLAMANSGPNTNGSQFFIVTAEATPWLDGRHTNFGQITDGMDVVDAIEAVDTDARDNPVDAVVIESIELIKQ